MRNDLDYTIFKVMTSIALERIAKKKVYWNSDDLFSRIKKPGLDDANALLRVFEKELNEHNSKLSADEKRIKNLNYKTANVYQSKYFKGINKARVVRVLKDNPTKPTWDIVSEFV